MELAPSVDPARPEGVCELATPQPPVLLRHAGLLARGVGVERDVEAAAVQRVK
jgi:hypothetical protein